MIKIYSQNHSRFINLMILLLYYLSFIRHNKIVKYYHDGYHFTFILNAEKWNFKKKNTNYKETYKVSLN